MGALADQNIIRRKDIKLVIVVGVLFGLLRLLFQPPAEATTDGLIGAVVGASVGGVVFFAVIVFGLRMFIYWYQSIKP